ncbi:FecR family protein [Paucibacter sp. O1-1]|nr:FecR family protein [Paucibacter sp. O1-1]MDA3826785.1 FecR family protein [Paucibacter sp. O1-1]
MGRRYIATLLLMSLAAPVAAAPACEVLAVRGEARSADRALAVGDRLEPGAELRTGTDGRVRLRFGDGSTLVVGDRTVLKIERFEPAPRRAGLLLESGLIGQKVEPAVGGAWEVRTPTAVTAVRGTEFIVEVGGDLATEVQVRSGKVEVEALQSAAGGGTRSLRPRSRVTLEQPLASTLCNPRSGCSPSAPWSAERAQRSQDRLGEF